MVSIWFPQMISQTMGWLGGNLAQCRPLPSSLLTLPQVSLLYPSVLTIIVTLTTQFCLITPRINESHSMYFFSVMSEIYLCRCVWL